MLAQVLAPYEAKAQEALCHVPEDSKGAAYQAWLGFYNSSLRKLRWSSEHLVQQANLFSATIGKSMQCPPSLLPLPSLGLPTRLYFEHSTLGLDPSSPVLGIRV